MDTNGRLYAEISDGGNHLSALRHEAEVYRTLHSAKPRLGWRSRLAAQLRGVAERLEPQPLPPTNNTRRTRRTL